MQEIEPQRPWYRQFWPWFVAFPPAATVVGGLVTAWLAGAGPSLVVDDYGQIGKVTAQRAFRDERARELGLSARLTIAAVAGDGKVRVLLTADDLRTDLPAEIRLRLVHPTRADLDAEALLRGSTGFYTGRIERPVGRLYVHINDLEETWRLVGELAPRAAELELRALPARQ